MSMAFYQGGAALDPKNLVFSAQNISKVIGQALKSVERKLCELAFTSKKTVPTYVKQVKANFQCELEREKLQGLDQTWVFTRNTRNKAGYRWSRSSTSQAERSRADWLSCYSHAMIPTPVKEPNTVYTCLTSLDKTFRGELTSEECSGNLWRRNLMWGQAHSVGHFTRTGQCNCSTGRELKTSSVLLASAWQNKVSRIFGSRVTYVVAMSQRR